MNKIAILNKAKALSGKKNIICFDLGKIAYSQAFQLQQDLYHLVKEKGCLGFLLVLEHPPVITLGSNRSRINLIADQKILQEEKIGFIQSTRGGDITFHGPGQLIAYPILNLALWKKDLTLYVHNLEQIIINTLNTFHIQGSRIGKHRGVFVDQQKIASVGIKIKRWITMHGLALNVSTDLAYFQHIVACGLKQYPPTSMQKKLKRAIPFDDVKERLIVEFGKMFTKVTKP